MTDREKLEAVAKGYTDLMVLYAKQKGLIAQMLRESHRVLSKTEVSGTTFMTFRDAQAARKKHRDDQKAALKGMLDLAEMLEREAARDSTAVPINPAR